MPDARLIVFLCPGTINKNLFLRKGEPVRWVYLGKQFHERARLEREMGPSFHCPDTARVHNEAADSIREEFIAWIEELNRLNGSSMEWWLGSVSSRNIYRSNLFQYCCFLEILDTIWKDPSQRPGFVVVESPALATIIQQWGTQRKIPVTVHGNLKKNGYRARMYGMFFLRWANFILTACLRKCAATIMVQKPHPPPGTDRLVLVHTYLHPESLSETGTFSDRYFPYLYEFLEKNGRSIAVIPTYHGFRYNFFPLFSRVDKSSTRFIIPEHFLTCSDLFHAFTYPLRLLSGRYRSPPFRAHDCTEMLFEDTLQDRFGDLLDAILVYRLVGRLKTGGLRPERCIDWYENQAMSKALSAGFKEHFPGTPLIGAQLFLHFPNYLSLSPTVSECEASMVPDRLLETGPTQCRQATRFAPELACKPCAALRYAHLFRRGPDPVTVRERTEKRTILLLASFDMEETLELLSRFQEIESDLPGDVRVQVKFHPDMKREEIVSRYGAGRWPDTLGVCTGTLSGALDDASVVISKNSSSIVEAAARGIPVIFLGNQTRLNLNPLAGIDLPGITECYTAEELRESVKKYLDLSEAEQVQFRKDGIYLRDLFFTDVNETTLAPFLE